MLHSTCKSQGWARRGQQGAGAANNVHIRSIAFRCCGARRGAYGNGADGTTHGARRGANGGAMENVAGAALRCC